jgi:dihydropyrimidinase
VSIHEIFDSARRSDRQPDPKEPAMHDLLIRNGTVVTPAGREALDVAVEGETIAALGAPGSLGAEARRVIDATGMLVIPGGIDPHVHYAMDFEHVVVTEGPSFTFAAAMGGNTSVIDFTFVEPPHGLNDAIADRKAEFAGRMAVDYSLHAILCKDFSFDVVEEIGQAIRDGIPTIKTMMTYGYMSDDGQRLGVMGEVAAHGGMSVVHAEDDAIANWLTAKYVREGKTHGAYICEVRGPLVEEAAVRRAMLLAERAGSPLYILHIAAGSAVEALAERRAEGLPFYGETLSAYLSFTQDDLWDESPIEVNGKTYNARGLLYNNYPTPKFGPDRETCWQSLVDGRLQVVATDHALVSLKDRFEVMGTTVDRMQAGQAAVETRIPVLYSEGVAKGRFSVERWVELISTNPAKLMGMWPQKGRLEAGADADIVVFDPDKQWTVDHRELHMSGGYSCWDGWELTGKVRDTILRGTVLVENENYVGSRTNGRFVPRTLLPEVRNGDFSFSSEALAV